MAIRGAPDAAPFVIDKTNAISAAIKYRRDIGIVSFFPLAISLIFFIAFFSADIMFFRKAPLMFIFMLLNCVVFTIIGYKMLSTKVDEKGIEEKLALIEQEKDIPFKSIVDTRYGNFIQLYAFLYGIIVIFGLLWKP